MFAAASFSGVSYLLRERYLKTSGGITDGILEELSDGFNFDGVISLKIS